MRKFSAGLTLIEIIAVISIIILISGVGTYTFMSTQKKGQLDGIRDGIRAQLEKAKANAMSGKYGQNHGVKFNSTSTIMFSGNSFSWSDQKNNIRSISDQFIISNNIQNSDKIILFSRISGIPNATGTISITETGNASNTRTITVGNQGEITVIK